MSTDDPNTPGVTPVQTGGEEPAATPQNGAPGASEDETITLSMKDYKAMQAQRDRANNDKSELEDRFLSIEDQLEANAKEKAVSEFLRDNKEKYPDLTADDFASVTNPNELEKHAETMQRRLEDAVQKKLLDVQKVDQPQFTPQEKADRLKQLKEKPSKGSFGEMVELRSS